MSDFPVGVATTVVHGTYLTSEGLPAVMNLKFVCNDVLKHMDSNTVIVDAPYDVKLRGNGYFEIELPVCQDDLTPNEFFYTVYELYGEKVLRTWDIVLDESMGARVSLVTLAPAGNPNPSVQYPTMQEAASIASDLDQALYQEIATTNAQMVEITGILGDTLDHADIGVSVPSLIGGKIPAEQLPPTPTGNYYSVANEAEMLALLAVRGDYALRSDVNKTFVLSVDDPKVLANWLELPSGGNVASVNGKTGTVVLTNTDVNASPVGHTHSTLPALTSFIATTGTIATLTANKIDVGGNTSLHTILDNTGVVMLDNTNTQYAKFDHVAKTLALAGGMSGTFITLTSGLAASYIKGGVGNTNYVYGDSTGLKLYDNAGVNWLFLNNATKTISAPSNAIALTGTLSATAVKAGSTTTNYVLTNSSGVSIYDYNGVNWANLGTAKTFRLTGGEFLISPEGATGGMSITTQIDKNATDWSTYITTRFRDGRASDHVAEQYMFMEYDSATSHYSSAFYRSSIGASSDNYFSSYMQQSRGHTWDVTWKITDMYYQSSVEFQRNDDGTTTFSLNDVDKLQVISGDVIVGSEWDSGLRRLSARRLNPSNDQLQMYHYVTYSGSTFNCIAQVLQVNAVEQARVEIRDNDAITYKFAGGSYQQLHKSYQFDVPASTSTAGWSPCSSGQNGFGTITLKAVRYSVANGVASIFFRVSCATDIVAGNISNLQLFNSIPASIRPSADWGTHQAIVGGASGAAATGGVYSDGVVSVWSTTDVIPKNTDFTMLGTYPVG